MKLYISTGNSRMEKRWNGAEMELEEFIERISHTIHTAETVEQYGKMTKARQDAIKDVGGFVMGKLKGGRRKKDCVEFRSALTLDMDHAVQDIPEQVEMFDDTTYEPSRLMYWPSTSADGEFIFHDIEGEPLNPDDVLSRYQDWRDSSEWPVSSRQQNIVQREMRKQADPLTKDGVIGAFCRTYSIEDAIANFLSDVYQPSAMYGRYATVLGQWAAMFITLAAVIRIYPQRGKWDRNTCFQIYQNGIGSIVTQSLYTLYIVGLNMILALFSEDAVTRYSEFIIKSSHFSLSHCWVSSKSCSL